MGAVLSGYGTRVVPHGGHSLVDVVDITAEISSAAVRRRRRWWGILGEGENQTWGKKCSR